MPRTDALTHYLHECCCTLRLWVCCYVSRKFCAAVFECRYDRNMHCSLYLRLFDYAAFALTSLRAFLNFSMIFIYSTFCVNTFQSSCCNITLHVYQCLISEVPLDFGVCCCKSEDRESMYMQLYTTFYWFCLILYFDTHKCFAVHFLSGCCMWAFVSEVCRLSQWQKSWSWW